LAYSVFNGGGEPRWRPFDARARHRAPAALVPWLTDAASLTRRLQQLCPEFNVRLLAQRWQRPLRNERRALQMRDHEFGLVRQVYLACGARPLVFARTVIPAATLRGGLRRYAHLGTRPLGALLFADRRVRRGGIEVAEITPAHALYRVITGGGAPAGDHVWGRRSVFTLAGCPLLVGEIFLPALLERAAAPDQIAGQMPGHATETPAARTRAR
jgi:chorismate--pyruvate lyase